MSDRPIRSALPGWEGSAPSDQRLHPLVRRETMWRIAICGQGVEINNGVRQLVHGSLRAVLKPYGCRVAFAHVRLWESIDRDGPTTCHIRVDLSPSGGLALGATAPNLAKAVKWAAERVAAAVGSQLACQAAEPRGSFSWPGSGLAAAKVASGPMLVSMRMTKGMEEK